MMQDKPLRYEALDGLRGIAAIMVIFYHYSLPFFDPTGVFRNQFFVSTSYAFVDLFFVLSGFVIAANYLNKINSLTDLRNYAAKRFARLYPLLLFTVIIYMGLKGYALFTEFTFDTAGYGWKDYLIDILEPLTFLNSTTIISSTAGMNPPSWSISAEMIAYLVFGCIVLLFKRAKWPHLVLIVLAVLFILDQRRYMFASDYGFVRGILGFSTGVLAFQLKTVRKLFSGFHEWVFMVLLILSFYQIHHSSTELTNLLLSPLYFYGIMVFSNESGLLSRGLKTPLLQFLGKISYSVYLMHFIILWAFYQFAWNVMGLEPSTGLGYLGIVLVLLAVVIISHFTYKWIERPGMKYLRSKLISDD